MSLPGWHEKTITQVLETLDTSREGLSSSRAASLLAKLGPNELREEKGPGPFTIFINQFRSFLIAILVGATIFSALIGEALSAIAIIIIVVLSAIMGFVQEYRAEKAIAALKRMTAQEAVVIRDRRERRVPARELVPGPCPRPSCERRCRRVRALIGPAC